MYILPYQCLQQKSRQNITFPQNGTKSGYNRWTGHFYTTSKHKVKTFAHVAWNNSGSWCSVSTNLLHWNQLCQVLQCPAKVNNTTLIGVECIIYKGGLHIYQPLVIPIRMLRVRKKQRRGSQGRTIYMGGVIRMLEGISREFFDLRE